VTAGRAREPAAAGVRRIRRLGFGLLCGLVLLTVLGAPWTERLQAACFDAFQMMAPRPVQTLPVTVVAIDQKSLVALGQWPWPRTQLARLVDAIDRAGPAAIGVDVLMPEPDALSPERLLARTPDAGAAVERALRGLPSNDAVLGQALASARAVLAIAGTPEATGMTLRAAPVMVHAADGAGHALAVPRFAGALTSVDALDSRAAGWGLISVDPTRGGVRRIPLVASIGGTLVPTLSMELLRVATGAPALRLSTAGSRVLGISVGGLDLPTEHDGSVRPHYSRHRDDRFVSAVDVLEGRADPAMLEHQIVLIGPTAIGLDEGMVTPVGEHMAGIEIQAQLLENLLGGTLLQRPAWAPGVEALGLLLLGALLVAFAPRWKPVHAAALLAGCVALPAAVAWAAFRSQGLLLDAVTPGLSLLALFGVLLVLTLSESTRQRRALEATVQAQREQAARIAGELQAAQRIQNGTLPRPDLLQGERRIDLHAALTPAREVGGDLYDFFMLDADRLFVLVGDVAGKGLSASIFMAVSKALYKGSVLRAPRADIGELMRRANAEVSRDNGEMLFVTAFAAVLDLRHGTLAYCNAGHDNPWLLAPDGGAPERLTDGDGPPLCAVPDWDYQGARRQLQPGSWLWLVTDGVPEARDPKGQAYGAARAERVLRQACGGGAGARDVVQALHDDVRAFTGGAEPHDDVTILALRWRGPAGG